MPKNLVGYDDSNLNRILLKGKESDVQLPALVNMVAGWVRLMSFHNQGKLIKLPVLTGNITIEN